MRDSERYMAQADAVMRMARRAANAGERKVYETIAEGWRKLAREAGRSERREDRALDDRAHGPWAEAEVPAEAPRRANCG